MLAPILGTNLRVTVLGFRGGSVIIDYVVEIEENNDNQELGKTSLEEQIKYNLEHSGENGLGIDTDSVNIQGKRDQRLSTGLVFLSPR